MKKLIDLSKSYYNEALDLVNKKDITNAIKSLRVSIIFYAKDIDVLNLLGICYFQTCRFSYAYKVFKKSLTIEKSNNLARYYLETMDSDFFSEILRKYNKGIDYLKCKDYKKVRLYMLEVVRYNDSLIEPYKILGIIEYSLNNNEKALEYFKKANSKDMGDSEIYSYISKIVNLNQSKKRPKVIGSLIILIVFLSISSLYYFNRYNGSNELIDEYITKETKTIAENINYEIDNKKLRKRVQDLEGKNKQLNNELFRLDNGKEGNSHFIIDNEQSTFNKAIKFYKNKEVKSAVQLFNKIINYGLENYIIKESVFFSGNCYSRLGKTKLALDRYKLYIDEYPEDNYYDDCLYYSAILLYKTGNMEEARCMANKLIDSKPNSIFVNSKIKRIIRD